MSMTTARRQSLRRRQCDRCGRFAKDAATGSYDLPHGRTGTVKTRGSADLGVEYCDGCWEILQSEAHERKIA